MSTGFREIPVVAVVICALLLHAHSVRITAQTRHLVKFDEMSSFKYVDWLMDLSPNGETLAYVVDENNLWLADTKQGNPRKLGQGRMPKWSPDGQRLAFYSAETGTFQLWTFDLKSGKASP